MPDSLSDRYAELLTGSYDCVDRIVLNAFFRMGHGPGGFRVWWQALTGTEETLDNAYLMRLDLYHRLKVMVVLVVLRNKAIKPLLAAAQGLYPSRGAQNPRPLDRNYETIRMAMQSVFQELGLAA